MTYLYNVLMNMVDRGDQRRADYPIQRRQVKPWKALFYNMVNIAVVNAFLLSMHAEVPKKEKFNDQRTFRTAPYKRLLELSARPNDVRPNTSPETEHKRVTMKQAVCVNCKKQAQEDRGRTRGLKRQALEEISPNNAGKSRNRHVNRARTGCEGCQVNLCGGNDCWARFHEI